MLWRCRDRAFDLSARTLVMGIVNVTPDSFSDGGSFLDPAAAADHARRLVAQGADLVDLGAESTRPGSRPVSASEQIRRLAPVLDVVAPDPEMVISVDTANAEVAAYALAAGARVVNDVTALGHPAMARVVAATGAGVVLMHMRGTPASMQEDPRYGDAASEVAARLAERLEHARSEGIAGDSVVLDPGIGFGKSARHNCELLARIEEIASLGRPVLVGVSRKSFLGSTAAEPGGAGSGTAALPVDQRLETGLAATAVAVFLGARIVRTHDVAPTLRAVRIAQALREARRASTGAGV